MTWVDHSARTSRARSKNWVSFASRSSSPSFAMMLRMAVSWSWNWSIQRTTAGPFVIRMSRCMAGAAGGEPGHVPETTRSQGLHVLPGGVCAERVGQAGGQYERKVADARDVGVVLLRVNEVCLRSERRNHAEDIADAGVAGPYGGGHAPGRPLEEVCIRALDADRLAGHRMPADKRDLTRQDLVRPAHDIRFGGTNIGDDSTFLEVRPDIAQQLLHFADGCAEHDDVCAFDRVGQAPFGLVDRSYFLGIALLLEVRVEADDLERGGARFRLVRRPAPEAETDRSADQAQSDDDYALHGRLPLGLTDIDLSDPAFFAAFDAEV